MEDHIYNPRIQLSAECIIVLTVLVRLCETLFWNLTCRKPAGHSVGQRRAGHTISRRRVELTPGQTPASVLVGSRLQDRSKFAWTFYRTVYRYTNAHVPSPYIFNLTLLITYKLYSYSYTWGMNMMNYTMKRYSKLSYNELFKKLYIIHSIW